MKAKAMEQMPAGTQEPMAKSREIVERIVADRLRTAHTLRCAVQGCHRRAPGEACQYCGTAPATGEALEG